MGPFRTADTARIPLPGGAGGWVLGVLGFRVMGLRALGSRVLGFRVMGLRALGSRGFGV